MTSLFCKEKEEGQQEEADEEKFIIEADRQISEVYNALPEDTLFILATCQGDTAGCRLMLVQTSIPYLLAHLSVFRK